MYMWVCPKCGREFKRTNQSHYCGDASKTIEEYIEQQEQSIHSYLQLLHQTIIAALPNAKQSIKWSMPTYSETEIIVQFAACKNHISLYVGEKAIEHFGLELKEYECKKSAIYLKHNEPLPQGIVAKIVKWCYEN